MSSDFDPGALLAGSYPLARGPRVCLRLARVRDLPNLAGLLSRQGVILDELELARLVRFDPRARVVICATALVGSAESVVGVGMIELTGERPAAPSLVVVDDGITDGLADLLSDALIGRARALARARAA